MHCTRRGRVALLAPDRVHSPLMCNLPSAACTYLPPPPPPPPPPSLSLSLSPPPPPPPTTPSLRATPWRLPAFQAVLVPSSPYGLWTTQSNAERTLHLGISRITTITYPLLPPTPRRPGVTALLLTVLYFTSVP